MFSFMCTIILLKWVIKRQYSQEYWTITGSLAKESTGTIYTHARAKGKSPCRFDLAVFSLFNYNVIYNFVSINFVL